MQPCLSHLWVGRIYPRSFSVGLLSLHPLGEMNGRGWMGDVLLAYDSFETQREGGSDNSNILLYAFQFTGRTDKVHSTQRQTQRRGAWFLQVWNTDRICSLATDYRSLRSFSQELLASQYRLPASLQGETAGRHRKIGWLLISTGNVAKTSEVPTMSLGVYNRWWGTKTQRWFAPPVVYDSKIDHQGIDIYIQVIFLAMSRALLYETIDNKWR